MEKRKRKERKRREINGAKEPPDGGWVDEKKERGGENVNVVASRQN